MKNRVRSSCYCALFSALIAVTSQISIPIPPIPFNLALLGVFLAAAILGSVKGAFCVLTYLAIGAVGLPVFAGFQGGVQVFAGPTGGFLVGYIVTAITVGGIVARNKARFFLYPVGMLLGCVLCYSLGTVWFSFSTHTPLNSAAAVCVLPFLLGDLFKIILASTLSYRINQIKK